MQDSISLWDHSSPEPVVAPPTSRSSNSEVAIVGGGFTGLSTALHLAEAGVDCQLFEAQSLGYGGSGRNVGLVNAGLWLPPQDVRAQLGDAWGDRLVNVLSAAPAYVFSLIEKHAIDCATTRTGTLHAAHSPRGLSDLARRAEEWQRLGAPVELLNRERAGEKIGSTRFFGALLDHRAGTINPMDYVRGLAQAASAAGASLHSAVQVNQLEQQGGRWRLSTTKGEFTANQVLLATNAYTDDLWPNLKRCFTLIHFFQCASEPLGERAAHILPQRQGLWDTGTVMFSLRRDQHGRIIVGSMGKAIGAERGLSRRWASKRLRRLFPELGAIEFEQCWHGQIAMTPNHLPRIYRLTDGLYTSIGYNGRGITTGTVFGKALAELLADGTEANLPLPISDLKTVPRTTLKARVYQTAFTANQVVKAL